jgi:uncharacterized membrane protein YbaN (DUF454 family)
MFSFSFLPSLPYIFFFYFCFFCFSSSSSKTKRQEHQVLTSSLSSSKAQWWVECLKSVKLQLKGGSRQCSFTSKRKP